MRNPKRIPKILKELELIWMKNSDLRLGQLLLNANIDIYHVEDRELIKYLKQLYTGE